MTDQTSQTGYAPFDLYPYNPAVAPAFVFLALFAIAGALHLVMMFPYRILFPIPLIIGCGMEATAYYFRSRSHDNVRQTLPYIIQTLLILTAPPFLAATIYMSLGRIARALKGEERLPISPKWITKIFVLVDVVCFATQFAGSILSGSDDVDVARQGKTIILVGLTLQMIAFGVFMVCILTFQIRMRSTTTTFSVGGELSYRRYLIALYAVSGLFLIRNVVRIVEYQQGSDGVIVKTEALLYVFDSCFMLAVVVIILVLHPGRLMRKALRLNKAACVEHGVLLDSSK